MIISKHMTLEECKIYLKTMGYYTPTRVDFTKTYHSPPKIHGLSIESVDFDLCDLKPLFLLIFPDNWKFLGWWLGSVWLVAQILCSLSCISSE